MNCVCLCWFYLWLYQLFFLSEKTNLSNKNFGLAYVALLTNVTKNQSLSVSNWYCWSCRAFGDAQDKVTQGKGKKPKATLKHKTNLAVRPRFFYGPFLPIWYCIDLSFWYLDAVCSAATGILFVWIPCGIPYVKTTRCHTWHQEGCCK
jgi:hypothetical protein